VTFNPVARWQKSPGGEVSSYSITWRRNGQELGTFTVNRNAPAESSGYESRMPVPSAVGDSIEVSVSAVGPTGQRSEPASASLRLELPPVPPPEPPAGLTLSPS
jgi:hypothetical protein